MTRYPLRLSYTVIAPVYDLVVDHATRAARRRSIEGLGDVSRQGVLLVGIGTGLDIPLLPPAEQYVGVDLTHAMLMRARARDRGVLLHQGDAMALPYADAAFDSVILHLILAVVPQPARALGEALRVLKPGGQAAVFDKFLKPGQRAPLRRLVSPVLSRLATRTDVVFEEVLTGCPGAAVINDQPALAGGWFRSILLQKM